MAKKSKSPTEKFLQNLADSQSQMIKDVKAMMVRIREKADYSVRRQEKILEAMKKDVKGHEAFLKEISRGQDMLDETLGSVLLAIRQNEYLQAYYPAQLGFSAGKAAGIHPAKLEKKNVAT